MYDIYQQSALGVKKCKVNSQWVYTSGITKYTSGIKSNLKAVLSSKLSSLCRTRRLLSFLLF